MIRHEFPGRGGIAKDVVFNSGGLGLYILLDDGFPLSVKVVGLSLDDRGFLFNESLAFLLRLHPDFFRLSEFLFSYGFRLDCVPAKGSLH